MANVSAYMPLYVGDYLADTMMLTRDQHGGYLLLIMAYWRQGEALPDDDDALAAITRATPAEWKKLRAALARFFEVADGKWTHQRIERELKSAQELYSAKVERAKSAASARWKKEASSNAQASTKHMLEHILKHTPSNAQAVLEECQSPSPSPLSNTVATQPTPSAPSGPLDLKAEIFRRGVSFLKANGLSEPVSRQMLGKWRKAYGDVATINALAAAEGSAVSEPIPYITATLAKGSSHAKPTLNGHGGRSIFAEIGDELAAREARDGIGGLAEAD